MKCQQYIKIVFLSFCFASSFAYGKETSMYDMDEVKDVSLLELKVLKDWHSVATTPPTQQKIVEITQCRFENGRKVRIPVTYVVPDNNQACHFIVSYGNLRPTVYKDFDGLMTKMLGNGVGFVLPAIGPISKMHPDGALIDVEMKNLLKKTRNVKYTSTWFRGICYMRAITAALTEKDRFLNTKIACDGRSKSAAAGQVALIHYPEVTGLYARVIPSSVSSVVISKAYRKRVEQDNQAFYQRLAAGQITQLGTIDNDAYWEMQEKAKKFVARGEYPKFIG